MQKDVGKEKRAVRKYKAHWHVLFTHFPISFFIISSGFMALHLFTRSACFETAAFSSLAAGAVLMVPTTVSGWLTWKGRYRRMSGTLFLVKIRVAFAMVALSAVLVMVHLIFHPELHLEWMGVYSAGIVLLMVGNLVEGYHGEG